MAKSARLWPTLKRLLSYGKPWRKSLSLAVGMLWIAAAAEVTGPVLVSYFIDNLVAKHQMPREWSQDWWSVLSCFSCWPPGCTTGRRCCLTEPLSVWYSGYAVT